MEKEKLIQYLDKFILKAEEISKRHHRESGEIDKQMLAKDFQDQLFSFLDYLYTNFPTDRSKLLDHFPRPELDESEEDYLAKVAFKKRPKSISIKTPEKMLCFLKKFWNINSKYLSAISYLHGIVKHEKFNDFTTGWVVSIEEDSVRNTGSMHILNDGSLLLGGQAMFTDCSNISIQNSQFGDCYIDKLTFSTNIRDQIQFKRGTIDFISWSENCIKILKATLLEFKEKRY